MDAQETSIYTSILITVLILGCIIAFFLISLIRHHKKAIKLYKLNAEAEITTQERERARIAADLHDELGPRIAAIKLNMNNFILTDETDLAQLQKSNENLNEIIRRLREISFDLLPTSLLSKGIVTALHQYIGNINSSQTSIKLQSNKDIISLPEGKSINIYRIVQEIIQNTLKYAHATELLIIITVKDDVVSFKTIDDGIGFNFQVAREESTGLGIKSIFRRLEMMDSELFIDSNKNGTSYNFQIKL